MVANTTKAATVKFLCSYGGKILPRYPDGELRYHGGHTRLLSFNRSVSFSELMLKMAEMCGGPVSLRCQLPREDLDSLVSVTSDEDLLNLIEVYDRASPPKIRTFLSPRKSSARKPLAPPPSMSRSSSSSSSSSYSSSSPRSPLPAKPPFPPRVTAKIPHYHGCYPLRNPTRISVINNGKHWQ